MGKDQFDVRKNKIQGLVQALHIDKLVQIFGHSNRWVFLGVPCVCVLPVTESRRDI